MCADAARVPRARLAQRPCPAGSHGSTDDAFVVSSPPDGIVFGRVFCCRQGSDCLSATRGAASTPHDVRVTCTALGGHGGLAQDENGSASGRDGDMAFFGRVSGGMALVGLCEHQN